MENRLLPEDDMEKPHNTTSKKGVFRYTKEFERKFFFYATIGMFFLYAFMRLFGE